TIIENHLIPALGSRNLDGLDVRVLEGYVAAKRRDGFAPRTVNRHLNLMNAMLTAALKRGLVRSNPVPLVDRPKEPRRRWTILSPTEIGRVERAFAELAGQAQGEERAWREQARVAFLVIVGLGLR